MECRVPLYQHQPRDFAGSCLDSSKITCWIFLDCEFNRYEHSSLLQETLYAKTTHRFWIFSTANNELNDRSISLSTNEMMISIESRWKRTIFTVIHDLNLCLTILSRNLFRIMPKLNKLLVTSIIADIRECVHVSNEIYSWLGDIEHLSWKFPTKTAKDINAMEIVKEHNGTAGEFYILLLELAYDRLFNTFFAPLPSFYILFSFVRYRFASA